MECTSTCRRKQNGNVSNLILGIQPGDLYEIVVNISKLHYRQMSSVKVKIQIIIYIFLSIKKIILYKSNTIIF